MIGGVVALLLFYRERLLLLGEIYPLRRDFGLYEAKQLLLSVMLHIECLLLQPFRQLYLWNWIGYSLQNCRNADHLLYLSG